MDVVEKKYANFKNFLSINAPQNENIEKFKLVPLDFFLKKIQEKTTQNVTREQCLKEIFEQIDINQVDIVVEVNTKLLLYLEYFEEISKNLL